MSLKRANNIEKSSVSKLHKCKTFEGLNDLKQYVEMKTNDELKVSVLNYLIADYLIFKLFKSFFCLDPTANDPTDDDSLAMIQLPIIIHHIITSWSIRGQQ